MKYLKHVLMVAMALMMVGNVRLLAGEAAGGAFAKEFLPVIHNAKAYSVEMAELMPEKHYSFKPVPEIMSFGEQVAHTASVTFWIMSKLKGESNPGKDFKAVDKSKAEIIQYLKDSYTYMEKVLSGLSDKEASRKIHLWGDVNVTKAQGFLLNRDHITHHRGAMVIYLRLKGIKPAHYRGW
jgi:uncharacterized damage-inducible protein DinB